MTYGPWIPTPRWQQWLGYPAFRRSCYAAAMIGGGWDGWEFTQRPLCEDDLSPRQRALAGEFVKEGHPMQEAIEMASTVSAAVREGE